MMLSPLQVAGVPMMVLRASVIFEKKWLATQIDTAAACPVQEGKENIWRTVNQAIGQDNGIMSD